MTQTNMFPERLTKNEIKTINEALFYAVRENLNQNIDNSKSDLLREALDIMKQKEQKPAGPAVCNRSLADFFDSCVARGWGDELEKIEWLEVE
ncbi:MAG: hypothetical protein ACOC2F_07805 [Bacteroidota bacterium]